MWANKYDTRKEKKQQQTKRYSTKIWDKVKMFTFITLYNDRLEMLANAKQGRKGIKVTKEKLKFLVTDYMIPT